MANLLFNYTAMDSPYTHGKFRFIPGDNSASPPSIGDPADTRIDDIRAYLDTDPVLFSYMNGSNARALLCNVSTDYTVTPPVSTGKYTVCVPTLNTETNTFSWDFLRDGSGNPLAKDVTLQVGTTAVAGNPYGVTQIGTTLYIGEYDSAKIYSVPIATLEGTAEGGTCTATLAVDATDELPDDTEYGHGAALVALPDPAYINISYLFALFTSVDDAENYLDSVVVRCTLDAAAGSITITGNTSVGANATGLVPTGSGANTALLVPAIGGEQQENNTNGQNSYLAYIPDVFNEDEDKFAAVIPFTGDPAAAPTASTNYDIHGIAASADGTNVYLLTLSYNDSYLTNWRLYKTNITSIAANAALSSTPTLSTADGLVAVASGYGDPGYFWEVLYDNTVSGGRLWFLKGSPIKVTAGGDYSKVLKKIGYCKSSLYDSAFNVNSADLIGETIYQATQGASINTTLGTTRALAKTAQAAAASATEEEEK